MKKYFIPITASLVASLLFALVYAFGATTISTNISTGGTLTVSGNSTFGDAATDVNLFTGTLQASTTALFTTGARMYDRLYLFSDTSDPTNAEGAIYYDSTNRTIKLSDGSEWFTVGTTTDGFTISGNRLQADTLNRHYSFGTTTDGSLSYGLNVVTLTPTTTDSVALAIYRDLKTLTADLFKVVNEDVPEEINYFKIGSTGQLMVATGTPVALSTLTLTASTTAGIPLSIKGKDGQIGHFFQVLDQDGTELFVIDEQGVASTTDLNVSSDFWMGGNATTTASDGNFLTQGTIGLGTTTLESNINLGIGGAGTSTIMMGKACFSFTTENGDNVWYWPCVGATCDLYGTGSGLSGWATSTTGCNDSSGDL